ncbi:MAG: site-specific integrase [Rhodospirillaceae bacterium]|nr:site-specific integrase [Rhodospirillaceae bacterium]
MTDTPTKSKTVKRRIGCIREIKGARGTSFQIVLRRKGAKPLYRSVQGTRKDAEKELRRMMGQLDKGMQLDRGSRTLKQWIDEWLDGPAKSKRATRTYERYRSLLLDHTSDALGNMLLREVTPAAIEKQYSIMLDSGSRTQRKKVKQGDGTYLTPPPRGLSARTVTHYHRVLSLCLKRAARDRLIDHNPCLDADRPSLKQTADRSSKGETVAPIVMQVLDQTDLATLLGKLAASKSTVLPYPLALLALDCGARRGELLALRWTDLDPERRALRIDRAIDVTKEFGVVIKPALKNEHSRRTVTLSASTVAALLAERARQEAEQRELDRILPAAALMFPGTDTETGLPLPLEPRDPDAVSKAFRRLAKAAGFPGLRFHDLRHNFASHKLRLGVSIAEVSQALGHANAAITLSVYSHAVPRREAGAGLMDSIMPPKAPSQVA